jgi:hypothetical protein
MLTLNLPALVGLRIALRVAISSVGAWRVGGERDCVPIDSLPFKTTRRDIA